MGATSGYNPFSQNNYFCHHALLLSNRLFKKIRMIFLQKKVLKAISNRAWFTKKPVTFYKKTLILSLAKRVDIKTKVCIFTSNDNFHQMSLDRFFSISCLSIHRKFHHTSSFMLFSWKSSLKSSALAWHSATMSEMRFTAVESMIYCMKLLEKREGKERGLNGRTVVDV